MARRDQLPRAKAVDPFIVDIRKAASAAKASYDARVVEVRASAAKKREASARVAASLARFREEERWKATAPASTSSWRTGVDVANEPVGNLRRKLAGESKRIEQHWRASIGALRPGRANPSRGAGRGQYSPLRNRTKRAAAPAHGSGSAEAGFALTGRTAHEGRLAHSESAPQYFEVLYDYEPQQAGDLRLKKSAIIRVQDKDQGADGWWFGHDLLSGLSGTFPSNFVRKHDAAQPEDAPAASADSSSARAKRPGEEDPNKATLAAVKIQSQVRRQASAKRVAERRKEWRAATAIQCTFREHEKCQHERCATAPLPSRPSFRRARSEHHVRGFIASPTQPPTRSELEAAAATIQTTFREHHKASATKDVVEPLRAAPQKRAGGNDSRSASQRCASPSPSFMHLANVVRLSNQLSTDSIASALNLFSQVRLKKSSRPMRVHEIRDMLSSPSPEKQLAAVKLVREMLVQHPGTYVDSIRIAGLVNLLLAILRQPAARDSLRAETLWTLSNLAATECGELILQAGGLDLICEHVKHSVGAVSEQAIWCVGNIAGSSVKVRDTLIAAPGLLECLVRQLSDGESKSATLQQTCCWAISNLCRGKPPPAEERILPLVPAICTFVCSNPHSVHMLIDSVWCIAYLTEDSPALRRAVGDHPGLVEALVRSLNHTSAGSVKLVLAVLRSLGNLSSSDELPACFSKSSSDLLFELARVIRREDVVLTKEALWVLSNMTCGTEEQLDRFLAAPRLVEDVTECLASPAQRIRFEAVWVLHNFISDANSRQVCALFLRFPGMIPSLLGAVERRDDAKLSRQCIEILTVALRKVAPNARTLTNLPAAEYMMRVCDVRSKVTDPLVAGELKVLISTFRDLLQTE